MSAGEGKAVIGTEERYEENLVSSRVPGLSPLLKPWIKKRAARGVEGGGIISELCGYVLHQQLDIPLFAVSSNSMTEFKKKKKKERKKISVKQDAIDFFTPQLVNWLQLVGIRNLSSSEKGAGIQYLYPE